MLKLNTFIRVFHSSERALTRTRFQSEIISCHEYQNGGVSFPEKQISFNLYTSSRNHPEHEKHEQ